MGKITKKKKGRPPKAAKVEVADLFTPPGICRNKVSDPSPESSLRRSIRRRSIKYSDEFYDDDDEEEEEEEQEKRKEKKMKVVLRLAAESGFDSVSTRNAISSVAAVSPPSSPDYGDDSKPFKKRRINGADDGCNGEEDGGNGTGGDDDDDDGERIVGSGEPIKEEEQNKNSKHTQTIPGLLASDIRSGIPLPDKKQLELILNKLQKKDTYGVYADPVDPEELPDYHDIIDNPIDFSTIRSKLEKGTYTILEQLEADIYLLCSNAMQYNSPDTVYFRQARTIEELARRKFERLRVYIKRIDVEAKSEQKPKPEIVVKKPIKKSASRILQEPLGSDFSSGATLATNAETGNWSNTKQAGFHERLPNFDGFVDGKFSLFDYRSEKAEDQISGKELPSKYGKKPVLLDENHRAMYNGINQHSVTNESMLTLFEGEDRKLIAVGFQAGHSYARSLARFSATLGPVAWKVASRRIEQALPMGFKFGRGWVGEYEPLPTSVLIPENHGQKDKSRSNNRTVEGSKTNNHEQLGTQTVNSSGETSSSKLQDCRNETNFSMPVSRENTGFIGVDRPGQQSQQATNTFRSDNNALKQVELNCSSVCNDPMNIASRGQIMNNSQQLTTSRMAEMVSRSKNLAESASFKQAEINGRLPNGKSVSNFTNNHNGFRSDFIANKQITAANGFPSGNNEQQGLSDPVQMLRMIAEKTQNQQQSMNRPIIEAPESSGLSTGTRAPPGQAWMTLGVSQVKTAHSSGPPVQNRFPPQVFLHQGVRIGEDPRFQNNRPVSFPQLASTDLSPFQVSSPWQGLVPHNQQSKKQDTLPPDLNIGFQSSPITQSSSIRVDSPQPDLALQL